MKKTAPLRPVLQAQQKKPSDSLGSALQISAVEKPKPVPVDKDAMIRRLQEDNKKQGEDLKKKQTKIDTYVRENTNLRREKRQLLAEIQLLKQQMSNAASSMKQQRTQARVPQGIRNEAPADIRNEEERLLQMALAESVRDQEMSYEELLELDENRVKRGFPPDDIKKIKWQKAANEEECKENCSICQDSVKKDDSFLTLKCHHEYHQDCIEVWFQREKICPNCKQEVKLRDIV